MLEPFDPAYLLEKTEIPQLSDEEITYVKRVDSVETMLKAVRIPFTYVSDGKFRVQKTAPWSTFPINMYVDVYDDCYVLCSDSKDLLEGEFNEVMNKLIKWYKK